MERNSIKVYKEKCNPQLFSPQEHHIRSKGNSEVNLNNVLNDSMTDSADFAFDFVNEIVNSSFESAQTPTAHSGSRVNKSMFEKWIEKCAWLIVNNVKEQATPSCNICQEQRDTLKL